MNGIGGGGRNDVVELNGFGPEVAGTGVSFHKCVYFNGETNSRLAS